MASLDDAFARLDEALGPDEASRVLRQLLHVPGALDWLSEEPVRAALGRHAGTPGSRPATALLAATGHQSLASLPPQWAPALASRRDALLSGQDTSEELSADDVLILAGEILRADRSDGSDGVVTLMHRSPIDWRAPLAVAFPAISQSKSLAAKLASSSVAGDLPALVAALRSNGADEDAAGALAAAAGSDLDDVLEKTVRSGDVDFAAAVAAAADRADASKLGTVVPSASRVLRSHLQAAWETRRGELAALTDAIAVAAAHDGDSVSALEARQQALQFGPTDERLAEAALTLVVKGDAAGALSLLPPTSAAPALALAAGSAFLRGGAVEKGRGMLIEAALNSLESGFPVPTPSLASDLVGCGEQGLALDVFGAYLAKVPSDASARCAYAQTLAEVGEFHQALTQARLALATDGECAAAKRVEAEALSGLGRPAEALALLKSLSGGSDPEAWKKAVECAISLGDSHETQSLLRETPAGIDTVELTLLQAKSLAAEGRAAEAIATLETAASANPVEMRLWLGLVKIQQDLGDRKSAGETLRRGTQMAPTSASLQAGLAHWLRSEGRPSEALDAARKALEIDPRNPQGNHQAGMALLALGRLTEALEPLRIAHRREPGNIDNRLGLAAAFEAAGELESARALFAHLPENAPAAAWYASGRLALLGDASIDPASAKTAAARILRARALGAQDIALPYWLGVAYEGADDAERAAAAYEDFLRLAPRDSLQAKTAAFRKAHALLRAGDMAGAVHDFEALRAADGQDPKLLGPLAHAYLALSLVDEARQAGEDLLAIDASDPDGLRVLASVAQLTGDWGRSAAAFLAAAEKVQVDSGLWIDAAETSLKAGDSVAASKGVDKALSASEDPALHRRAALILVGLGDSVRAERLLKSVTLSNPNDSTLWIELADVAERAGDLPASIDALNRVAELEPDNQDIQFRRATALWTAGRRAESIGAWQKLHELTPDDLRAHRALAKALVANGEIQAGLNQYSEALHRHPGDAVLLTEAGVATLRHGSAQESIDLLQPAVAESPTVETLAALGEAWLRLGQPERAFGILQQATQLPAPSAGAWALLAEAAVSLGDVATAQAAIVEARRPDIVSVEDHIALARAELRLANWGDALTALAPVLAATEIRGQTALAQAILRVLEARWLFSEAALARRHAPPSDVPAASLMAWLETSLAGPLGESEDGRTIASRWKVVLAPEDEAATSELQAAVLKQTADSEAAEALAIAHLRQQRPRDALDVLRQLQPDDLGSSWQAPLAGLAHLQAGNPSLARQAFVDASGDAGLRPLAQSLLARAHLAQGYTDSAIAALNAALTQWTDEPAWHAALADLYLSQGDVDAALPHLQSAAELEPENAAWKLILGRALREAGHVGEARLAYDRLLPLLPSDAQVWHEAGDLALEDEDFARAEALFDRAVSLAPSDPTHVVGKAQAALAAGKVREARKSAEAALRIEADRSDALLCLAAVAARQGEPDRALDLLDRAAIAPKDPAALRAARARLLVEVGRSTLAAEELRAHLAANPDDEQAWASLAMALEAAEEYPAAGQALEAALRLSPRSAALQIRLARVERKSGQLDRALDLLRQAEALEPMDADLALELGQVYEARRELDHALDAYVRSAQANPRAPEAFRRAGHVFKSLKAYGEAEQMLERAAELDPTDTATLQQLAAVRALEIVHGGTYRMAVTP